MAETELPLALVTGAAHRLGRVFALCLARLGYAILLHFNSAGTEAEQAAHEISSIGAPVYCFRADLTRLEDIDLLFSYLDTLPHKPHVLVNSAAIMRHADVRSLSLEDWDATMALNLRAPWLVAQRGAARMSAGGLIVNVTDAGLGKTWTGFPDYLVSKTGLDALTRLLAKALAPSIRVNAIAPGLVLPSAEISESEWEKLVARLPLQRPTPAEDVASALEFLIKNGSITGQTIVVDGGYSLI